MDRVVARKSVVRSFAPPYSADAKRVFWRRLRAWFRRNARPLPWREDRDPYRVWISEVMLQQTQVATALAYFKRFLAAFPTVESLAAAPESAVLRLWEGLGYYRRARQLHRAAQAIVDEHGGEFPRDAESVRKLPGIGRYTAGAILSIAFDQREAILEANTVRLYSRLAAFRGDPHDSAGQRFLWEFAEGLLPQRGAGEINQALMEVGSQVCTPVAPRCHECPLVDHCAARHNGLQSDIPRPKKKPAITHVRQAAVVVRRRNRILLVQRGEDERWAGLWDFPRVELGDESGDALARRIADALREAFRVDVAAGARFAMLRHSVTRYRITLECHWADHVSGSIVRSGVSARWFTKKELAGLPLNTTGRKIVQLL